MVYLVDDDTDDLEIVEQALKDNSYKGPLKTAENGMVLMNDLYNLKGSPKPAVIILDLNMPLKNGFDVLKELKCDDALNDIPVIILTASSNRSDETRCRDLGCAFFFRKPYRLSDYDLIARTVKGFIQD